MTWTHDVVVIGAGAGGLTAAGGCGRLGLRVALIERDRMGGECLHSGCVPSKALLAASHRAAAMRGDALGVRGSGPPVVDWPGVRAHVDAAIGAIAPHDDAARFGRWGVEVVEEAATLVGPDRVAVAGRVLRAKRIVLAVGSDPATPTLDGLGDTPFLTNETVFASLDACPSHLVVLGGGPNGVELAQAFRRLGAAVTLIERHAILGASDADAVGIVRDRLRADGVRLLEGFAAAAAARSADGIAVTERDGQVVAGSHLLVASGRVPRLAGLGLDAAGVRHGPDGIVTDRHGRTSNPRVFAVGDCRAGPRLTHAAGEDGAVAVARIGFGVPSATARHALPSVVYTDPELAQVGLTEAAARERGIRRLRVEVSPFDGNDRAVAEGDTAGFLKLVLSGSRILGVTIVGRGAGDLVLPWRLAMTGAASLWSLSGATIPYPTRTEITKAAAFAAYEDRVFGRAARLWARTLARVRR